MVSNATYNNISVVSWRSVLLVEENILVMTFDSFIEVTSDIIILHVCKL
jgi:hypothetical protein